MDYELEGEFEDFDDELDLTLYADDQELAHEVTDQTMALINKGLKLKGVFHLVLTGGTLGTAINKLLIDQFNQELDSYLGLHLWWSDERFVPADSPDRNDSPFLSALVNQKIVLHRAKASDLVPSVDLAVADYLIAMAEVEFDLIILGLGPDGHVASIFPGISNIDDSGRVVAVTNSPKLPVVRTSFTMATINSAQEVWIIAAGESKAAAVTKILEGDLSIPASYVRGKDHTRLIVDTEALFTE